jgi:hypothetical protein
MGAGLGSLHQSAPPASPSPPFPVAPAGPCALAPRAVRGVSGPPRRLGPPPTTSAPTRDPQRLIADGRSPRELLDLSIST